MAHYTTQVRSICEEYAGLAESVGFDQIENVIAASRSKIFTLPYPMYEGGSREELETKILRHYYMREIGFETVGLWKHFLNTRMCEIMPYYRDYWYQRVNDIDPKKTIDLTRVLKEIGEERSTNGGTRTTAGDTVTEYGKTENRVMTDETQAQDVNVKTGAVLREDGSEDVKTGTVNRTTSDEKTKTGQDKAMDSTQNTKSGQKTITDTTAVTRTGSETTSTDGSETRTPEMETKDKYSDTPQNGLSAVESGSYLTNYRVTSESGTETVDTDTETTKTYNSVKDQKSGTITENYSNYQDTRSGGITTTYDTTETMEGQSAETYDDVTDTHTGSGSETYDDVTDTATGSGSERQEEMKSAGGQDATSKAETVTDDYMQTGNREKEVEEHTEGIANFKDLLEMKEKILGLIVNIDMMIINDLSDLFMRIY